MYRIKMIFNIFLGVNDINNFMEPFFPDEGKLGVKEELEFTGTYSEIPKADYIQKVCEIIKEKYKTESFTCLDCEFNCFKEIKNIDRD